LAAQSLSLRGSPSKIPFQQSSSNEIMSKKIKDKSNDKMVGLMIPLSDLAKIDAAAQVEDRTRSAFFRVSALERATKILENKRVL
jgi:uncharacterized protein (DUF1778 family)